jgi:hypothetical protein
MSVFIFLLLTLRDCARSRAGLQLEILAFGTSFTYLNDRKRVDSG